MAVYFSKVTPIIFQISHTLPEPCHYPHQDVNLGPFPLNLSRSFLPFHQGSMVEGNVFSLWVRCGLRNGLYWPMWRCSEFICIVK